MSKIFLNCTVEEFEIPNLIVFNNVETDPSCITWKEIMSQLKAKYNGLVALQMWEPEKCRKGNSDNEITALTTTINKLVNKFDKVEV